MFRKKRLKAIQKEREKLIKDLHRFEKTLVTLETDRSKIESSSLTEEDKNIQFKLLDSSISRVKSSIKRIKKQLEVL